MRFLFVVKVHLNLDSIQLFYIASIYFIILNMTMVNELIIGKISEIDEINLLLDLVDFKRNHHLSIRILLHLEAANRLVNHLKRFLLG